ncbi:hypothetical protein LCM19_09265 [Qipengyuania flava]|nr:hypothetical protein [Qipengyuania flava]
MSTMKICFGTATLIGIALLASGCAEQAASGDQYGQFSLISMNSPAYQSAARSEKTPSPEFPVELVSKVREAIDVDYMLQFEYFETAQVAEKAYDIFLVVEIPDTFIGVAEDDTAHLLITL